MKWFIQHPLVREFVCIIRGGSPIYRRDRETSASYLQVRRGKVARTISVGGYLVDVDRWGNALGVENLNDTNTFVDH